MIAAMTTTNKGLKDQVQVGYQVFLVDGGEEVGAVRDLCGHRPEILVYVENAHDFVVPVSAIKAVHFQKVILDQAHLPDDMRLAMRKAHAIETD
jgi:hypothetical protein